MADAVAQGVKVLITTGGHHQSNHKGMTAAVVHGCPAHEADPGPARQSARAISCRATFCSTFAWRRDRFPRSDAYFTEINSAQQGTPRWPRRAGEKPYIIPLAGERARCHGLRLRCANWLHNMSRRGKPAPDLIVAPVAPGGRRRPAGSAAPCSARNESGRHRRDGSAVLFSERIAAMAKCRRGS